MKRIGLVVGFVALAGLIGFVVRLPSGGGNSNTPAVGAGGARGMAPGAPAQKSAAGGAVFGSTTTMSGGGSPGGGGPGARAPPPVPHPPAPRGAPRPQPPPPARP